MQTATVPTTVPTNNPRRKLIRRLGRSVIAAAATTTTIAVTALPALAAPTTDRWTPPARTHNGDFVTTDVSWSDGVVTSAVIPADQLPLSMVVEQEVADRLGLDRIRQGIESWNGIPGSRFSARIVNVVNTGARSAQNDGVHRVFLDGRCQGDQLGWGYLNGIRAERRYGTNGSYTFDGDIGVCSRLLNSPDKTVSTLRHELGHVMGLGHIDASCRIMSARHDSCESMTAGDHNAARYLYPTLPRLAGPTRTETAARTVYATRPAANAAATVVLADGFGGSALPVAAAAYAGAIDAPLLLGDASCTAGAAGMELRRVARPGATVALVGGTVAGCSRDVQSQGYKPVVLGDVAAVADQMIAARRSDTVFVIRGPLGDGNLPDGLTAAAAAGRLGAPVLFANGGQLAPETTSFLNRHPLVRRAVIVGGEQAVPQSVVDELNRRGIGSSRHGGQDRITTALAVADIPGAFAPRSGVAVAAADKWADAISGSAIGAARGWPVLLTPPHALDGRVAGFLAHRATGGYVLGGQAAVSDGVHLGASAQVR